MIFPRDKIQEMIRGQKSIDDFEFIHHDKNGNDDDHGRDYYELIFKYKKKYYCSEHFWDYDDPGSSIDFEDDCIFIHWEHWPLLNSNQVWCPEVKKKKKVVIYYA